MASEDVFNELEKTKLKKLFDRLDADKDGKIVQADLKALAAEFGKAITDERAAVTTNHYIHSTITQSGL